MSDAIELLRAELRRRKAVLDSLPPPEECKRLREAAGLTKGDIGEAIGGCTSSTVAGMERGKFSVRVREQGWLDRYIQVIAMLQEEEAE